MFLNTGGQLLQSIQGKRLRGWEGLGTMAAGER